MASSNDLGWISDDNQIVWLERKRDGSIIYFAKDPKDKFFKCPVTEVHKLLDNDKKTIANGQVAKVNVRRAVPLPDNLEEIYGQ